MCFSNWRIPHGTFSYHWYLQSPQFWQVLWPKEQGYFHCSLEFVTLHRISYPGLCSYVAAFCVNQYTGKRSVSRCGICCLQNLKSSVRHCASFFTVGGAKCDNSSFTLDDMTQPAFTYWGAQNCPPMAGPWILIWIISSLQHVSYQASNMPGISY